MDVLKNYPPEQFVSAAQILADLGLAEGGCESSISGSISQSSTLRQVVESRKGRGGGYRLKRIADGL